MSYTISVRIDTTVAERILDNMDSRTDKIVREYGEKATGLAGKWAPYDTGALSASIIMENMGYAHVRVGPTVGAGPGEPLYAIYQELGFTHYKSGKFIQNPYLTPAVESIAGEFLSAKAWQPLFY